MVFHATIATSIRDIVRDPIDRIHGVRYDGNMVTLYEYFPGADTLNISNGNLGFGNIQSPERHIVKALAKYHHFAANEFRPEDMPNRETFYLFPTIFELERLARDPLVIGKIQSLDSDGRNLNPDNIHFQEQAAEVDKFAQSYAAATLNSPLQKPVLQGFYERIKRENLRTLEELRNSGYTQLMRTAKMKMVWQEEDFASAFGRNIYQQLREILGEPKFV